VVRDIILAEDAHIILIIIIRFVLGVEVVVVDITLAEDAHIILLITIRFVLGVEVVVVDITLVHHVQLTRIRFVHAVKVVLLAGTLVHHAVHIRTPFAQQKLQQIHQPKYQHTAQLIGLHRRPLKLQLSHRQAIRLCLQRTLALIIMSSVVMLPITVFAIMMMMI
jgi:hypothetical protein